MRRHPVTRERITATVVFPHTNGRTNEMNEKKADPKIPPIFSNPDQMLTLPIVGEAALELLAETGEVSRAALLERLAHKRDINAEKNRPMCETAKAAILRIERDSKP